MPFTTELPEGIAPFPASQQSKYDKATASVPRATHTNFRTYVLNLLAGRIREVHGEFRECRLETAQLPGEAVFQWVRKRRADEAPSAPYWQNIGSIRLSQFIACCNMSTNANECAALCAEIVLEGKDPTILSRQPAAATYTFEQVQALVRQELQKILGKGKIDFQSLTEVVRIPERDLVSPSTITAAVANAHPKPPQSDEVILWAERAKIIGMKPPALLRNGTIHNAWLRSAKPKWEAHQACAQPAES